MTSSTKPGEHSADEEASPAEVLAEELTRLAEGYRRLPHSKFALRLEPYGDRAQAGHWLAAQVTMVAQGMERWDSPQPPRWRDLPRLGVFALGDQIAVVGNDLVAAYRALEDPREHPHLDARGRTRPGGEGDGGRAGKHDRLAQGPIAPAAARN